MLCLVSLGWFGGLPSSQPNQYFQFSLSPFLVQLFFLIQSTSFSFSLMIVLALLSSSLVVQMSSFALFNSFSCSSKLVSVLNALFSSSLVVLRTSFVSANSAFTVVTLSFSSLTFVLTKSYFFSFSLNEAFALISSSLIFMVSFLTIVISFSFSS